DCAVRLQLSARPCYRVRGDDFCAWKERCMRLLGLTLAAVLVAGPVALAQSGATPAKETSVPVPKPLSQKNQNYLDAYLKAWEERMASIQGLETKVILTEVEDGQKTVFTGDAALMKPNYAKLFLKLQDDPTNQRRWRRFVADGQYFWDYDHHGKVARVLQ